MINGKTTLLEGTHIHHGSIKDLTTFLDMDGNPYELKQSTFGKPQDSPTDPTEPPEDPKNSEEDSDGNGMPMPPPMDPPDPNDTSSNGNPPPTPPMGSPQSPPPKYRTPQKGQMFRDMKSGKTYRWDGNNFVKV